jgi:hypothetical protein
MKLTMALELFFEEGSCVVGVEVGEPLVATEGEEAPIPF